MPRQTQGMQGVEQGQLLGQRLLAPLGRQYALSGGLDLAVLAGLQRAEAGQAPGLPVSMMSLAFSAVRPLATALGTAAYWAHEGDQRSQLPGGGDRVAGGFTAPTRIAGGRSEERRVGKECRSRWSPY